MMKVKKLVILTGMLFAIANQANALNVSHYKSLKNSDLNSVETYINGVGQGISWSNLIVKEEKKQSLYCPPQGTALNGKDFVSKIDEELKLGSWNALDQIEVVLIVALKKSFPCD